MSVIKRMLEGQKFLTYSCKDCKEKFVTQVEPKEKKCPVCGGKLLGKTKAKEESNESQLYQ